MPVIALVWLITSAAFAVALTRPTNITLAHWDQPNGVNYQSNDPYALYVEENSPWWNVFKRNRYCRVGVVSHVHTKLLYGHWTEYEFHNYWNEPDYFTKCVVAWEADGVTVTEPTGHRLFIPKNSFIGGR